MFLYVISFYFIAISFLDPLLFNIFKIDMWFFLDMSPSISKATPIISGVLGAIFFGIAVYASPSPDEDSDPRENTILAIVAAILVLQFALAFGSGR